jgi:rare lipoprotein A
VDRLAEEEAVMTGRGLIIAGVFILAALGIGIYCGFTIGAQVGRAEVAAALAPEIAENRALVGAFGERLERLAGQVSGAVEMLASHYGVGDGLHGMPTAQGVPFDAHGLTVAHRVLPFGTVLLIENPANGRAIIARVADFGPAEYLGRDLDISYGCAVRLGVVEAGVVPLRVRIIGGGK